MTWRHKSPTFGYDPRDKTVPVDTGEPVAAQVPPTRSAPMAIVLPRSVEERVAAKLLSGVAEDLAWLDAPPEEWRGVWEKIQKMANDRAATAVIPLDPISDEENALIDELLSSTERWLTHKEMIAELGYDADPELLTGMTAAQREMYERARTKDRGG